MEKEFDCYVEFKFQSLTIEEILRLPIKNDARTKIVMEILRKHEERGEPVYTERDLFSWADQWRDHIPD
ncbi:MAG: hypothetical protein WCH34_14300 [Bacteroidota bacterium]